MENDNEELRKKMEKKHFTKNSFIETQIWIYSSFSALSLAFFFSLLGADERVTKDFFTDLSIYSYSISLVSNAFIAFIFSIFRDDGDLIHKLNLSKKMSYIIFASWISFIFSVLFTIGIFSKIAMVVSIILGTLIFIIFKKTQKDIIMEQEIEHELKMEKIKTGEID